VHRPEISLFEGWINNPEKANFFLLL